ncbi:MAG: lysoplasmalogenase [Eubacterium sp.]|nr:lysoplasmalogenase [Eubacterium sp.]
MSTLQYFGIPYFVILGCGCIVTLIFCIKRAKGFSISNIMLKIASSLCFILTAVAALICNPGNYLYAGLIIFGLVLGMCGDITLDLKGLHENQKDSYMLSGFIFFLIGHIFYQAAIIYKAQIKAWIVLICIAGCILFSLLNLLSVKITKYVFGKYKFIVFLYTVFLALTTALSAVAMVVTGFDKAYVVLFVGAVLFMLSDLILSGTYFGTGQDKPIHYFTNHLTYYAAQYLIAATVLLM